MFLSIDGQKEIKNKIKGLLQADKIAQSYLFYGPVGSGKFSMAIYFSLRLFCLNLQNNEPCMQCNACKKILSLTHPDLSYIYPCPNIKTSLNGEIKEVKYLSEMEAYISNKINTPYKNFEFSSNCEIRIDYIRMLQHKFSLSSNEADYKICIIEDCEKMNLATANAFLKTLEEPPQKVIIILITSKINKLLPTIISRCQKLAFSPFKEEYIQTALKEKYNLDNFKIKLYSKMSNRNLYKALSLAENIEENKICRELIFEFLNYVYHENDFALIEFVNEKFAQKNNNLLNNFIDGIIIFLNDVMMYEVDVAYIINLDKMEEIKKFYLKFINCLKENILLILSYLREMKKNVNLYVRTSLLLLNIYLEMLNYLKECY